MVICGQVPGQLRPRDPKMPEDLIGFVAENTSQPLPGNYTLELRKGSSNSWIAALA
jgi:hypothetical protein